MEDSAKDDERPYQTWSVHRQDDDGNELVVAEGLSKEEAERLAAEFESHGHRQLYWATEDQR